MDCGLVRWWQIQSRVPRHGILRTDLCPECHRSLFGATRCAPRRMRGQRRRQSQGRPIPICVCRCLVVEQAWGLHWLEPMPLLVPGPRAADKSATARECSQKKADGGVLRNVAVHPGRSRGHRERTVLCPSRRVPESSGTNLFATCAISDQLLMQMSEIGEAPWLSKIDQA